MKINPHAPDVNDKLIYCNYILSSFIQVTGTIEGERGLIRFEDSSAPQSPGSTNSRYYEQWWEESLAKERSLSHQSQCS